MKKDGNSMGMVGETMIKRRELHMVFMGSDNRKHKEVIKNIKGDISAEETNAVMNRLVELERPQRNGVVKLAAAVSAKLVEVRETLLFKVDPPIFEVDPTEQETAAPMVETVAEPEPMAETEPEVDEKAEKEYPAWIDDAVDMILNAPTEYVLPKMDLSLSEMSTLSPNKVAQILYDDLGQHGVNDENLDIYFSKVLQTQALNGLLAINKRIHKIHFKPTIKRIIDREEWWQALVAYLPQLSPFFSPFEWLNIAKDAQVKGRGLAAEFFGRGRSLDYDTADTYLEQILVDAQERYDEYRGKQQGLAQMIADLQVSDVDCQPV